MRLTHRLAIAILVVPVTLAGLHASAQEWTRFRGPNGTGVNENATIPARWSPNDINWKVALPGVGHSSPVLWGEKIFLLSADPDTATRYVLCLSTQDGNEIWRRDFPSQVHHLHDRNSFASCTPAVDEDRIYVAWSTPEKTTLMALDHAGKEVWNLNLGTWTSQHGFGTSPMLYEDMVILFNSQQADRVKPGEKPGESFMLAVDAATGEQRWRTPRTSIRVCYSTPCVYREQGGEDQLICTSTAEGVYSLDPHTGKENWRVADAFKMRVCSSPAIAGGMLLGSTGSGGGGNYVVAVRPGEKPTIAYTVKSSAPYVPSIVAKDDLAFLFGDKGIVTCIDARSGDTHWRERLSDGFSGSPVIAGDTIFCIDDAGTVHAIAAEKEFKKLGENPLNELSRSTPAISAGRLYVRTISHLYSVGGK